MRADADFAAASKGTRAALRQKTRARWERAEPLVLLALLAFAFLEYFYAGVMNTILSAPSLIFFIFPS